MVVVFLHDLNVVLEKRVLVEGDFDFERVGMIGGDF